MPRAPKTFMTKGFDLLHSCRISPRSLDRSPTIINARERLREAIRIHSSALISVSVNFDRSIIKIESIHHPIATHRTEHAPTGSSRWCFFHKKREAMKLKDKFYFKNGAQLLEESIASFQGGAKPIRIFSTKELEDATNNYAEDRILDGGGFYTSYKGSHEGRTITVKRYEENDRYKPHVQKIRYKESINEAVILSHVNHRNVVKFLGCCVETEIPILVCEYVSNGTLYHHLHKTELSNRLSWENRLRIATEIAYGLAHLHIGTSRSIVHTDIKSSSILLDDRYTTKIIDFGQSVLIPLGEKYAQTKLIAGTHGYIDPQYLETNLLTEKSDVYGFGVVFVELLTGKRTRDEALNDAFERIEAREYLVKLSEMEQIDVILKACIPEEGNTNQNQLVPCVELAVRCTRYEGEERPTMKEVVEELRRIERL